MSGPRKYAVQKPKGSKWETLALVDDLADGQQQFQVAVSEHGAKPIRLIQVDFRSDEALADFDWRLIELHDPNKGKGGRPKPTVIAGSERAAPPAQARKPAGRPGQRPAAPPTPRQPTRPGSSLRPKPDGEKIPIPMTTYAAAFLFGALALVLWALWFKV